jgi:hypothetical protein
LSDGLSDGGSSDADRPWSAKHKPRSSDNHVSRVPSLLPEEETIMSSDPERRLLARAGDLADTSDLAELVIDVLASARAARLDPDAITGLTAAALGLGADGVEVYRAGDGPGVTPFANDAAMLEAIEEAESDARGIAAGAGRLRDQAGPALRAAHAALTAARAMPSATREQADARSAALAEAAKRVALARDALQTARALVHRLGRVADRLAQVPEDLREVYDAAYGFIARDGVLPASGDWLTGMGSA